MVDKILNVGLRFESDRARSSEGTWTFIINLSLIRWIFACNRNQVDSIEKYSYISAYELMIILLRNGELLYSENICNLKLFAKHLINIKIYDVKKQMNVRKYRFSQKKKIRQSEIEIKMTRYCKIHLNHFDSKFHFSNFAFIPISNRFAIQQNNT